jgi:hypothetical protein
VSGPDPYDSGEWDAPPPPRDEPRDEPPPRPRPRRWVTGLAMVTVFVLGVVGGVVADRYLAVGCATCAPPAGQGQPLVGFLESSGDGLIAVRTPDGRLVPVRTSPATRLLVATVAPAPLDALPRGSRVSVLGVPDTDGTLTAQTVAVPG